MKYENPIFRLSLLLETFAYLFPVVLFAYFVVIAGNFLDTLGPMILGSGIGSVLTLSGGVIARNIRLGPVFEQIVEGIKETSELVEEITKSSEQQDRGIGEMTTSIEQINEGIQQSAVSSGNLASAAEELKSYANDLDENIRFFSVKE